MHETELKELAGRTVLVTGGADLVGGRIAAHLRRLGARPLSPGPLDAHGGHTCREDPAAVQQAVAESDYVIHAAALVDAETCTTHPMAVIHANITATQVLLDAVAACSRTRRFVFVSSADVYGNGNPEGRAPASSREQYRDVRRLLEAVYGLVPPQFHENSPLRPMSVYANTKVWGETQTALTLGAVQTSYTILRYFSVYGEPQVVDENTRAGVVARFAARAALGLPLHLTGGGRRIRDLIHVEDVAAATVRSLVVPQAHHETLNIATGTATSTRTVADLIAAHYPDTRTVESPPTPADPLGGYGSTHHTQSVLGWRATITLQEGIARYAAWLDRTPEAFPAWLRSESEAATA